MVMRIVSIFKVLESNYCLVVKFGKFKLLKVNYLNCLKGLIVIYMIFIVKVKKVVLVKYLIGLC